MGGEAFVGKAAARKASSNHLPTYPTIYSVIDDRSDIDPTRRSLADPSVPHLR
jgi:hypothetical protein